MAGDAPPRMMKEATFIGRGVAHPNRAHRQLIARWLSQLGVASPHPKPCFDSCSFRLIAMRPGRPPSGASSHGFQDHFTKLPLLVESQRFFRTPEGKEHF
jgi:hypothetical protein